MADLLLWRNRPTIKSKALFIPPSILSHLFTISYYLYCVNKSVSSVPNNGRHNSLSYAAVTKNSKFQQLVTTKVFFLLLIRIHCKLAVAFDPCHSHTRRTDDGGATIWNSTGQLGRWKERWRIIHIKFHFTYISLDKENQMVWTNFKDYGEWNPLLCPNEREIVYQWKVTMSAPKKWCITTKKAVH